MPRQKTLEKYLPSLDRICNKNQFSFSKEVRKRKNALYLIGAELEFEQYGSQIEKNLVKYNTTRENYFIALTEKHLHGNYYICSDGSLRQGAEVVLAPKTPEEWKLMYPTFKEYFKDIKTNFCSMPTHRMGLHFHVSKTALSEMRWQLLSEHVMNKWCRFFQLISRRTIFEYCMFGRGKGKYSAINFYPHNTVEFRFFAGTNDSKEFFGSLEIIEGLIEFFRICDHTEPKIKEFISFLNKRELNRGYIIAKNLIKASLTDYEGVSILSTPMMESYI